MIVDDASIKINDKFSDRISQVRLTPNVNSKGKPIKPQPPDNSSNDFC